MPNHFYLDASALAKRYAPEPGTPVINHLFSHAPAQRLFVLHLGVAEVVSILVRKHNAKILPPALAAQAFANLEAEIINQPLLQKLDAEADLISAALTLIRRHSINATDAALLRSALDLAADLQRNGDDLVLVASDQRLLRAAQAEGLLRINPEMQTAADLDLLLV
ncbi:MAG TPA: type II toxin-antitoxin system VapC family toxin [Blastocatellia bacterium]|nr:type II toxin-antitoxin system VapC family toxin [Blastocatellia bacterium]HMX29551.1 type II toxin-antitoxin system VapC family toxin [Blastocatellia bacterium]HMY74770.1 type II toxin-antitoxin system VapC family toxin [Blastocatellia bacterium]HMZ20890.1 type II toxin-antitoxin system VapC family toxin [Blastocatellia bacterium]HNG32592.1 type II toxin-antitoxin system VapC family toxin [Blastocatellia bacterium]